MAFSGAGTFNRLYTWVTDRINGVPITDTRMDAEFDGIATGLSNCITKDGQTTTTARIPFAAGTSHFDGTVGTPAINFTSDTDSGFYRIGANNIGVAVNGAKVLDVSTSGLSVTGVYKISGDTILTHPITPNFDNVADSIITLGVGAGASLAPIHSTQYLTLIGKDAGGAITTADHITAVGAYALASFTSQVNTANTAIGIDALRVMTSGTDNVAVGEHAGTSATALTSITSVGAQSMAFVTGGTNNTAIGQQAMVSTVGTPLTTGLENTAIGAQTMKIIATTASGNTALGYQALSGMGTANFNTAIGHRAGASITTGSNNVCVGIAAGSGGTLTTGSNNILIGTVTYPADTPTAGTSAYLNIGGIIKGDLTGATGVVLNKVTITPVATAATLTIPDGVTLTGPAASGTAMTLGNAETVTGAKTFGSAGAVGKFKLAGTTSGTTILDASATASGTLTLPAATDTLVGKATTDTLTNKTFDTAGTGNSLSINGVAVTANTGTGAVARAAGPTFTGTAAFASGTFSGTLAVGGVFSMTSAVSASGTMNLSGGDSTSAFTNATLSFGYDNTNTFKHWVHTRHAGGGATAGNGIDFYTNDGTSAGVFPTNAVHNLTLDGGNIGIGVTAWGTNAARVIGIKNGTAPASSPAGMGQLYVESGALKYRGSSGTVTTIAVA